MDEFKKGRPTPYTVMITEYLLALDIGDTATYEELEQLTGLPCQTPNEGYRYVQSAIKRCERQGRVFDCIPNTGYIRLDENGKLDHIGTKQGTVRRRTKRNHLILEQVKRDELNQSRHAEYMTLLATTLYTKRLHSLDTKVKMIDAFQKQQDVFKIDYEKLTETYLRGKETEPNSTEPNSTKPNEP